MVSNCNIVTRNESAPVNPITSKYLKVINKTDFSSLINDMLDIKYKIRGN